MPSTRTPTCMARLMAQWRGSANRRPASRAAITSRPLHAPRPGEHPPARERLAPPSTRRAVPADDRTARRPVLGRTARGHAWQPGDPAFGSGGSAARDGRRRGGRSTRLRVAARRVDRRHDVHAHGRQSRRSAWPIAPTTIKFTTVESPSAAGRTVRLSSRSRANGPARRSRGWPGMVAA